MGKIINKDKINFYMFNQGKKIKTFLNEEEFLDNLGIKEKNCEEFFRWNIDKLKGYLRFEDDHYRGGKNPWVIATLWMALYYLKNDDKKKAIECLNFVVNSASSNGLLSEQVDNSLMQPSWVLGLGWSHAMFIIVLEKMLKG